MKTYVLTTGYKSADVAHREQRPDIPACTAHISVPWQRIEARHAQLLNINACRDFRCFPHGWDS